MGGHLELIWFGLALAGISAGVVFLFRSPYFIEEGENPSPESGNVTSGRYTILTFAMLIGALGLVIAIWHAIKLIFS